jgi:hypothetical protein
MDAYPLSSKMKIFKLSDVYGNEYFYKCENEEDAKECFKAENGDILK